MSFIGTPCPICEGREYEQVLRWKGIHIALACGTIGAWGVILLLDAVWGYIADEHILPTLNRCKKCGNTFRRQHLAID